MKKLILAIAFICLISTGYCSDGVYHVDTHGCVRMGTRKTLIKKNPPKDMTETSIPKGSLKGFS